MFAQLLEFIVLPLQIEILPSQIGWNTFGFKEIDLTKTMNIR